MSLDVYFFVYLDELNVSVTCLKVQGVIEGVICRCVHKVGNERTSHISHRFIKSVIRVKPKEWFKYNILID